MILLDLEERIDLLNDYIESGVENRHVFGKAVAEAQLRKVVEWGMEHCPHAGPPNDDPTQEKKYCNACWQALKKEAGG